MCALTSRRACRLRGTKIAGSPVSKNFFIFFLNEQWCFRWQSSAYNVRCCTERFIAGNVWTTRRAAVAVISGNPLKRHELPKKNNGIDPGCLLRFVFMCRDTRRALELIANCTDCCRSYTTYSTRSIYTGMTRRSRWKKWPSRLKSWQHLSTCTVLNTGTAKLTGWLEDFKRDKYKGLRKTQATSNCALDWG